MDHPPAGPPTRPAPSGRFVARELPPRPGWRLFLLSIARHEILAACDRRMAALALPPDEPGIPGPDAARRRRLEGATLADVQDRAAQDALRRLVSRLGIRPEGQPRTQFVHGPPAHDLVVQVAIPVAPEVTPPDPATIALERLVARPGPAEIAREVAALPGIRTAWVPQPPGTPAKRGDTVVCDAAATLEPQPNRIPQPGLAGAEAGRPGRLPETWAFGDNGAGLSWEVAAVAPDADPPFVRLRVWGTAPADGQSYVMFHTSRAIRAEPGSTWVGSLALRPVGAPVGLRGGKLRIYSKPAEGDATLQRKDAALAGATVAATAPGEFGRVYVSNTLGAPETSSLLMTVLFDHAAGPVEFGVDLALPRLVEGLDLDQGEAVPLPRLSGPGQRYELRTAVDPLGLTPHLLGIRAGEAREVALRLADGLGDRALVGRRARLALRATEVLRRTPPTPDTALAQALGFADLAAMEAEVARRAERRCARQTETVLRARLEAALLAATEGLPLSEPAAQAELSAIWPALVAAAGGTPPPPEAARAAALRSLRLRLVVEALARRLGIAEDPPSDPPSDPRSAGPDAEEAPEARQARRARLRARVLAEVLQRARVTDREVSPAELAAAARAAG